MTIIVTILTVNDYKALIVTVTVLSILLIFTFNPYKSPIFFLLQMNKLRAYRTCQRSHSRQVSERGIKSK